MAVETAVAQCTSRWAMARGHRLNTSIVLAAVHGLSSLFRAVSAVEPSLSRPHLPLPSLISNSASVDVNQKGPGPISRQSPGEIKRREVSWTLQASLEEIKRREVSWTLTKRLAQKRSRGGR